MTNWEAVAGLTTIAFDGAEVIPPPEKVRARVSAVSSESPVNVATPPFSVTDAVPWSGPVPVLSLAATVVLLSPVSRLP